ncbi:hypothetical protein Bbelb_095750 [Branchiostoma belcheri]|nr:hypothetical protein Bbelb_095750 [Branchiostoma belcheri]
MQALSRKRPALSRTRAGRTPPLGAWSPDYQPVRPCREFGARNAELRVTPREFHGATLKYGEQQGHVNTFRRDGATLQVPTRRQPPSPDVRTARLWKGMRKRIGTPFLGSDSLEPHFTHPSGILASAGGQRNAPTHRVVPQKVSPTVLTPSVRSDRVWLRTGSPKFSRFKYPGFAPGTTAHVA